MLKTNSKKVISLITMCMLCISLFSGFSKASATSAKPITVTFMTWETKEMNAKLLDSFKQFEVENPGITVKLIPSPLTDFGTKVKQMMSVGKAPDIFQTGNDMVLQLGKQGKLYNWHKLASADGNFLKNFYPGVIENWGDGNNLYGLPGLLNCYGIFYNKKFFKDAGVPLPKIGWTYTDMIKAAEKISPMITGKEKYAVYNAAYDPFNMSLYSVSAGGAPFANAIKNVTKVTVDPKFIEGVKLISAEIQKGVFTPPTYPGDNEVTMFMQGKIPMLQGGQWNADQFIRNAPKDLDWGYAPNPTVKKQSVIYDCVGYTSPNTIKNPEAVYKVLKYLDTKSYEIVLPTTPVAPTAYQPSTKPYYDKLKTSGHADVAATLDYILKSPNKQPVRFQDVWAASAQKFIDVDWNNILMGKTDVSKLDSIVVNVNKAIAAGK